MKQRTKNIIYFGSLLILPIIADTIIRLGFGRCMSCEVTRQIIIKERILLVLLILIGITWIILIIIPIVKLIIKKIKCHVSKSKK